MKYLTYISVLSALFIGACSGPRVTMETRGLNPDFEPHKFEAVALVTVLSSPEQNQKWESNFADALRNQDFKIVPTFEQLKQVGLDKNAAIEYLGTIQADGAMVTRIELYGEGGESMQFVTQNDPGDPARRPEQANYVESENYYATIWPNYEIIPSRKHWTNAAEFKLSVAFYDLTTNQLVWQGMTKRIKIKHFESTYPRFIEEVTESMEDLRTRFTE